MTQISIKLNLGRRRLISWTRWRAHPEHGKIIQNAEGATLTEETGHLLHKRSLRIVLKRLLV